MMCDDRKWSGDKLAAQGKRVLLVDADPQCTLTGALLGTHRLARFYQMHGLSNLMAALSPLMGTKAEMGIRAESNNGSFFTDYLFSVKQRTNLLDHDRETVAGNHPPDGLFLLAGHPHMYQYEERFSRAVHHPCMGNENILGAFHDLFQRFLAQHQLDYILVDMSSSNTDMNRLIFHALQWFLVPSACDLFSLLSTQKLGQLLLDWDTNKERLQNMVRMEHGDVRHPLPSHKPIFLGCVFQKVEVPPQQQQPDEQQAVIDDMEQHFATKMMTRIFEAFTVDVIPLLQQRGMALPHDDITTLSHIPNLQMVGACADQHHVPAWTMSAEAVVQSLSDVANTAAHHLQYKKIIQDVNKATERLVVNMRKRMNPASRRDREQLVAVQKARVLLRQFQQSIPADLASRPAAMVARARRLYPCYMNDVECPFDLLQQVEENDNRDNNHAAVKREREEDGNDGTQRPVKRERVEIKIEEEDQTEE